MVAAMVWMLKCLALVSLVGLSSACNSVSFGAGARQKRAPAVDGKTSDGNPFAQDEEPGPGSDASGYAPITSDLDTGGWVTKEAFPELSEQAKTADPTSAPPGSTPGGPSGNPPGTGSPGSNPNAPATSDGGLRPGQGPNGSTPPISSIGDTNTKDPNIPAWATGENGVFWVPCAAGQGSGTMRGSLTTTEGARVRVAGELCPEKQVGNLDVLFVVDFSGSMDGNPFEGPNDPLNGGSCGRLQAAEALLRKFSSPTFRNASIRAGMVAFADSAQIRLPMGDLQAMQASLTPANWCGAASSVARTNYRAAFEQAQNALAAGSGGQTVIYFISDGSPTLGGTGSETPHAAGLAAARNLRQTAGDQLILNVVYLGYRNGSAQNPQAYLEQVAGGPNRVRLVSGAGDLVEAVQQLDVVADTIGNDAVRASHVAKGNSKALNIVSLQRSTTRGGAYVFVTEPFSLVGEVGKSIENLIEVKATSDSGAALEAKALIDFTLKK